MNWRIQCRKSLFVICSLIVMCCGVPVHAGGLYFNEVGTPVMGNAGAGAQAEASDASTAFHNPAGMTLLDGRQFMLTGGLIYSEVRFESDGGAPITGGDYGSGKIDGSTLSGEYDRNDLYFLGLHANWKY